MPLWRENLGANGGGNPESSGSIVRRTVSDTVSALSNLGVHMTPPSENADTVTGVVCGFGSVNSSILIVVLCHKKWRMVL